MSCLSRSSSISPQHSTLDKTLTTFSQTHVEKQYADSIILRDQENILFYGTQLLSAESTGRLTTSLGKQRWNILEQVLFACGAYRIGHWMQYCFSELRHAFPGSIRVKRLAGFIRESLGDTQDALNIYTAILEKKPDDSMTRKRIIATLVSKNRIVEAIDFLTKHLIEFGTDTDAWHILSDLYVSELNLPQALFCLEELILQDPYKLMHVLAYAELLASTGENESAIQYFFLVLNIQSDHLRGLWGVVFSAAAIIEQRETSSKLSIIQKHQGQLISLKAAQHACAKELVKAYCCLFQNELAMNENDSVWCNACLSLAKDYVILSNE